MIEDLSVFYSVKQVYFTVNEPKRVWQPSFARPRHGRRFEPSLQIPVSAAGAATRL